MIQLERRIEERYPHWFGGHRGRVARPLLRTLGRCSRLQAIDGFLAANVELRGFAFGVDPGFSDSVDGLVEIDLQRLRPKQRQHYLQAAV